MNKRLRVGLIFGGRSGEYDVSMMSVRSIFSALDPAKYEVVQIGITRRGEWLSGQNVISALEKEDTSALHPSAIFPDPYHGGLFGLKAGDNGLLLEHLSDLDVVFPVLHGTFGEDGTLQGLLEMANLAYVGAGVLASSVGMDKALFKDVMRANGIPVADSLLALRSEIERDMDAVIKRAEVLAGYPLFTKPANLGSSVGITRCRNRSELAEGILDAVRFDRRVLIERAVPNPHEIEISVLGNDQPEVSLPGEVVPADDFYSYNAKYYDDRSKLLIPAPLPDEVIRQLREIAVKAYKAIDGAGMARADFLVEKESNKIYLSEINTIPGFTKISMYPKLWEASGLSYTALVDRLIALALERKADRDRIERYYKRG